MGMPRGLKYAALGDSCTSFGLIGLGNFSSLACADTYNYILADLSHYFSRTWKNTVDSL
jgi:hypothetical protein